jgi:hypothetical protein
MKRAFLIAIPVLLFSVFIQAQTPDPKVLVAKPWGGFSEQNASFTRSGKAQLEHTLSLTLNDDNTVTGTGRSSMTMDGVTYRSSTYISGTFYRSNWTVYIKDGYTISSDPLPNGLKWCKGWGTLQFYTNATHPGYYILKGDITDDCGGKSNIEFTDYPNAYK